MPRFVIDGSPVGKARPRFTKFGKAYTAKETISYENWVKLCYKDQIGNKRFEEGAICVEIMAFFEPVKSISKKKRDLMLQGIIHPTKKPDIDNIAKIILDALNEIAWKDDTQVTKLNVIKAYSEVPRVVVTITEC